MEVVGIRFPGDSRKKIYHFKNDTGQKAQIGDVVFVRGSNRRTVPCVVFEVTSSEYKRAEAFILGFYDEKKPIKKERTEYIGVRFRRFGKVYFYRNDTGKRAIVDSEALVINYHGKQQWVKVVEVDVVPGMVIRKSIEDLRNNHIVEKPVYNKKLPMF